MRKTKKYVLQGGGMVAALLRVCLKIAFKRCVPKGLWGLSAAVEEGEAAG
jgi:hypothetical protein